MLSEVEPVADLLTDISSEKDVETETERDLDCSCEGLLVFSSERLAVTFGDVDVVRDIVNVGDLVSLRSFVKVSVTEGDFSSVGDRVEESSAVSVRDSDSVKLRLLTDGNSAVSVRVSFNVRVDEGDRDGEAVTSSESVEVGDSEPVVSCEELPVCSNVIDTDWVSVPDDDVDIVNSSVLVSLRVCSNVIVPDGDSEKVTSCDTVIDASGLSDFVRVFSLEGDWLTSALCEREPVISCEGELDCSCEKDARVGDNTGEKDGEARDSDTLMENEVEREMLSSFERDCDADGDAESEKDRVRDFASERDAVGLSEYVGERDSVRSSENDFVLLCSAVNDGDGERDVDAS